MLCPEKASSVQQTYISEKSDIIESTSGRLALIEKGFDRNERVRIRIVVRVITSEL